MSEEKQNKKPGVISVFASALAAFVGVQNNENLERDFKQSSIIPYLIVGAILAAGFIVGLVMIAKQLDPGG